MEKAGVGGGDGGESAALFDGGYGGGVGVFGEDLERHFVGEDSGGGVLAEDVGALGDGPDGAVSGGELDFVDGGFERGFQFGGEVVEDESGASEQAGGGGGVADGVFFAFGLQEDQASVEHDGLPEV